MEGIISAVAIGFALSFILLMGLWCLHTLLRVSDKAKEVCSSELPYKVDPVHTITTVDVALPEPETDYIAKSDHFEPYCAPKRPYTKRSKYWTDKRKKAAAAKARKTKRKSK
jgi:hypothetical protein